MNVRQRITHYQTQRNWSLNRLAIEAELNPSTVANWFKKGATPSVEAIGQICNGLGISMSEFFNDSDKPAAHLTDFQQDVLSEFDLLHNEEKEEFLRLFKAMNRVRKNCNPL